MDKSPSKVPKGVKEGEPPISPEYQMYMDERMTKKKKKILVRTGPRSGSPSASPTFEMPTSDKTGRFLPPPHSAKKTQRYPPGQYGFPTDPRWKNYDPHEKSTNYQPNRTRYESNNPSKGYPAEQNSNYQPNRILTSSPKYETNKPVTNDRLDYRGILKPNYSEDVQNQASYPQPMYTNFRQNPNKQEKREPPQFDLEENPSLICRAVNYEGEPVKVNDELIEDKLILSCRPRTFYGLGGYSKRPPLIEGDRGPNYPSAPPLIHTIEEVNINRTNDIDIRPHYRENDDRGEYPEKEKPPLERHDAHDLGSLGLGEGGVERTGVQTQATRYEEQYRIMQCKKYTRNFRGFLWALFIINTLLLITGLAIMILCMHHLIFNDYMNRVIMHAGFVIWVWVALALSLVIIAVAVYGIVTAVTRRKPMIRIWQICAIITIVLIFIFLLVYWLLHSDMQELLEKSMERTRHLYRCDRWIRHAWDTLHEEHKCCGIENRSDWKYIPPSCCRADGQYTKLKCLNHFIDYEMAYNTGCRSLLGTYFTTLFLLLTVFLVWAIILLFLGIIVAWRLLKMYKVILLCRDTYSVTS